MPCNHAFSTMRYRISTHSDEQVDAAGGVTKIDAAYMSQWCCERETCINKVKSEVAGFGLVTPVVMDGPRKRALS